MKPTTLKKEQVNVEIVGNKETPHKAIKKLAIGEVTPIEVQDEDEDTIVHVDHDPTILHVSPNEHGEAFTTRNDGRSNDAQSHSHEDGANNEQVQTQLSNQERSEDNPSQDHGVDPLIDHDHDDEDDGPI
jgi:hypothetical protein